MEKYLQKKVGLLIRNARRKRGWSQKEMADLFNIDQSYISNLESGRKAASLKTLSKISTALNIDINDFFEDQFSSSPLTLIEHELEKIKKHLRALESENRALKDLMGKIDVLKNEEFSEILRLLAKANPRVRSLTLTLLKYGTLSREELEAREGDFPPMVLKNSFSDPTSY